MIRDRMPDLLALARTDPDINEPEIQPSPPVDPELKLIFDRAGKVNKYIDEMLNMMWKIDILQDEMLTSTSFTQELKCRQQSQTLNDRYNALTRKTKSVLKRMCPSAQEMQGFSSLVNSQLSQVPQEGSQLAYKWEKKPQVKVTWYHLGSSLLPLSNTVFIPAEIRIKFHLHNILDYRLSNCVRDYYMMQKIYSDRCRDKMQRQLSILGRNIPEGDIDRALEEGETMPLLHHDIVDDKKIQRQKQMALLEAESLHREIISLERSIEKLHESFVMVWTLVHEQGAIIDRIENQVDLSVDYVEKSKQELRKASNFQHKYRKKKCLLALLIAIIIIVVIIIILASVGKHKTKTLNYVYVKPPKHDG